MGATSTAEPPLTWVVGGSGLLGSAVRAGVAARGGRVHTAAVDWNDVEAAIAALLAAAGSLDDAPWRLLWCAGAGVVASDEAHFRRELAVIGGFLDRWQPRGSGAVFFASSAGAVYAGSYGAPFTEQTPPAAISPYGSAKLRAEELFRAFAERTGVPLLLGRIANLYGPGQDLGKGQGIVSLLCRAHLTGVPLNVYVPLDTIRDYLYADDAATMALDGLEAVAARGGTHLKILASGQSLTLGGVIGAVRQITRRRPPIVAGRSVAGRWQSGDLRLASTAWPPLQSGARTPMSVGIASCLAAVEASLRCPQERGA